MSKTKKDPRPANPEIYEPDPDYDTKIDISRPHPETPETAGEQREAKRMAVKGESARGRTDISLDTLREKTKTRRFDVETPKKINEINFFESPEIQQERFDALRDVTVVMLANILHANRGLEQQLDISNFENVAQLRSHMAGIRPGPAENAAFHKILELLEHSDSEVSRHFASEWGSLAGAARQIERDMRALETADLRSRHAPEEKGVISKTVSFVKKHPLISFGIALAGAYGVYKLVSGIRKKLSPASGEKKESGAEKKTGFTGWLIGAGAAILAIFGLGRFLGKDGVKKFFKEKMGWDLSASRAVQTLTLISQGKFKEAWEAAWEGVDDNADFHKKMADHIIKDMNSRVAVSGKTLFELRDDSFENYMHGFAQTQDDVSLWARKYGGNFVSFLGFDSKRKNEEQIVIRNFFKKHEARMRQMMKKNGQEINEETSIGAILEAWYRYEVAPGAPKTPEQREPGSIEAVVETEPGKSGVGIDGTEISALRERFKNKSNFQKFLEKYDGNWSGAILSPVQFLNDLFSASNKDGIPVVLTEGSIFLLDADIAILFSSVGILWDTAINLVAAPFTDKVGWSDVIGTYMSGAAKFVVIGAVGKGVIDKFSGKGFWAGTFQGAKRGLLFPVEIPRLHVTAGQWMYRTARGATFEVRRMFSGKDIAIKILEEQARFHAEIARSYDRLIGSAHAPVLKRNWYAWYTRERAEKLQQRHLRRFRISYNELQEQRAKMGLPRKTEISMVEIEEGENRMKKANEFLDETTSIEVARSLDVKGSLFRNPDGSFRSIREIKANAARLQAEISVLPATDPSRAAKQKELLALEAYLTPAKKTRALSVHPRDFLKLDDAAKSNRVFEVAAEIEAIEKGTQARFNAEVEKIVAEAKLKKLQLTDPLVTAKLEKLDQTILIPFAKQKQSAMQTLVRAYESIPAAKRTPLLRSQLRHTLDGVDGTVMTRVVKGAKGRAKMMVLMASLMFATDQIIHQNETEREFQEIMRELGPDMKQLLLDVLPFIGTYSNFHSAFSGREIVTKRNVSGVWDRVSNVIWGTVGLAGDTLTVLTAIPTGGGSITANVVLRLAKAAKGGSKTAAKLLQMWPRISKVAERMGGWYKFAKKTQKYVGQKPQVLKGLRKIETVGMAAGTAMLAGGLSYHLYYAFADGKTEIQLPSDLQAEAPPESGSREAA